MASQEDVNVAIVLAGYARFSTTLERRTEWESGIERASTTSPARIPIRRVTIQLRPRSRSAMLTLVSEWVTVIVSLLGGTLGGGILAWLQTRSAAKTNLRGRARLVHEDLRRLQSSVTRLYYMTDDEGAPGDKAWFGAPLADKEDQQDVVAHLKHGWQFEDCTNALGWAEYFRRSYDREDDAGMLHSDRDLQERYWQFEYGRRALADIAGLKFEAHDPSAITHDEPNRTPASPLREAEQVGAEGASRREPAGR